MPIWEGTDIRQRADVKKPQILGRLKFGDSSHDRHFSAVHTSMLKSKDRRQVKEQVELLASTCAPPVYDRVSGGFPARCASRFGFYFRHPACALGCAVLFAVLAFAFARNGVAAHARLAEHDPVKITDLALDRVFNQTVAEQQIKVALASGDTDLAQSFVDLAAERSVSLDPALTERVKDAGAQADSLTGTAGRFVHGLWTGEPVDGASLAGTAFGDLFVFGDIRDAAREGTRYLTGQQADPWILGLAGVGLAITAGTYATLGASAPARIGLSLVKAARRTGRINPVLAVRATRDLVKVEEAGGLMELVGNTGRIESKAGTQAALEGLQVAEQPEDMSQMARLAAAKGGKTRAVIKLLGRAAIVASATVFEFASWLLWAAMALLGFASSCKAAAERITLRYLRWRRARRLRHAMLQPQVVSARL